MNPAFFSVTIAPVFGFALMFWLMIFLDTWRHFPKMQMEERIKQAIINATGLTLFIVAIVYLILYLISVNL